MVFLHPLNLRTGQDQREQRGQAFHAPVRTSPRIVTTLPELLSFLELEF